MNLPGARLLGLERSRVLGRRFRNFVSEGTRPLFDSWLKQLFATNANHPCLVTLQMVESQTAVEIDATLSLDELEARAVMVDITYRKALEEKLQHAQKMEIIGQLAGPDPKIAFVQPSSAHAASAIGNKYCNQGYLQNA